MPVNHSSSIDKLFDYVPDLIDRKNNMMNKIVNNKKEQTEKVLKEMQKRHQHEQNVNIAKENAKIHRELNNEKQQIRRDIERARKNNDIDYEIEYDETQDINNEQYPEDD